MSAPMPTFEKPPRPAHPGKNLDARLRLQNAARRLFYERGYLATTMRDIATACGVTAGAIYNHFPSKSALLYSVVIASMDHVDSHLGDPAGSEHDDAAAELRNLVEAFVRYNCLHPDEARVTNYEYRHLSRAELAETRARRRRIRSMFARSIARLLQTHPSGINGTGNHSIPAMAIVSMCISTAEWYNPRGRLTIDQVAELYSDMAMGMVTNDVPRA
jgi:AcrR family transcriptional regulator